MIPAFFIRVCFCQKENPAWSGFYLIRASADDEIL